MELKDYRLAFFAIGLVGVLVLASPTIGLFIKPPVGEPFSVIYILGPSHTFDNIPFDIRAGVTYSVFLGVQNHVGSSEYYTCYVKLGNENAPLPDQTLGTTSLISALFEYKSFISDGTTWEAPLTFEVNQLSFNNNVSQISSITLNGVQYQVNASSTWDPNKTGYYYNLFVELSSYSPTSGAIQYSNRFVDLFLNMTQ